MILHYFKNKKNKDKKISSVIYLDIINSTDFVCKNFFLNKNKDFNLIFEISSILLISVFIGLNKNNKLKFNSIKQDLIEFFIRDIDHSLRLEGISDLKIGRIVKLYVKKFYYRISKFEKIYEFKNPKLLKKYLENFRILSKNQDNVNISSFYDYLENIINKKSNL